MAHTYHVYDQEGIYFLTFICDLDDGFPGVMLEKKDN